MIMTNLPWRALTAICTRAVMWPVMIRKTKQLTELFNPRHHNWAEHFRWEGVLILGNTAIGRTTIEVLKLNAEERLQLRMASIRKNDT
jgi:hypothetical protein